jgi:PAS domain S-box-containing protein
MFETTCVLTVGLEQNTLDLRQSHPDPDNHQLIIESVQNAASGIDILNEKDIHCVVSGYELSDGTGIEFLKTVRDINSDLPFILYTDSGNEAIASEAINAGVSKYVRADTDSSTELFKSVRNAVETYQNQVERRRENRRYQAIVDDPNLLVGFLDTDGELLEANPTAAEYIGRDIDEMIDKPFWETAWWDEETKPLIRQKVEQAANGEYVEYTTELTDAGDETYTVRGAIRPVIDETGQVLSLAVSALDVTEQKRQRQRLQEEQQLIQGILDALPDVLYAFEPSGTLLRWNEQLETVTGYPKEEIEDMYVTDFVPDEEVAPIAEQFQTVISEHRSVTVESAFETKNGESIPYEFTGGPIETDDGEIRGLVGIGRDISKRKQRQRRFEAVFNNTYQFTGLMKPDGTLLEVNQSALSFGDIDREDVVGEKIWDAYFFQASETARDTASTAVKQARSGDLFREQLEVQGAERDVIIDFSVRPITDDNGNVTLLIPEGRDITRLKEREQQLKVTNRVIRHNIRNRLSVVSMLTDSLAEDHSGTVAMQAEKIREAVDQLTESAERARRLNKFIETEPDSQPIDLAGCLQSAVTSIQERYPEARVATETPEVARAEAVASIETAIEELLENGIVHNESDQPKLTVSVAVTDSTPEIVVTDNAGGIPEMEKKILTGNGSVDPLDHGQGLGLWYVYYTVRYSGGSISVSEQHPGGSEIRLSLPRGDQ